MRKFKSEKITLFLLNQVTQPNQASQALFIAVLGVVASGFLLSSPIAFGLESFIRIPCGVGFLRDCDFNDRKLASAASASAPTDSEPPVVPKLVQAVKSNIKTWASFLYNDGEDARGNKMRFDEGKAMNLFTGEAESFGSPVCSRCRTPFNKFQKEVRADYRGNACGAKTTTVRVTTSGNFIRLGDDAFAWHRGVYPMLLNFYMKSVLSEAKNRRTITYAPGCRSFASEVGRLTEEAKGKIKQLADLLGEKGVKESLMSEKDFDRLVSSSQPSDSKNAKKPDPNGFPQVDRKTAAQNPDQGKLRQLAQHVRSAILSTEAAIAHLTVCTISEKTGVDYRRNFGSWPEFFGQSVIDQIGNKVESRVSRECGSCSKMGICLDCANRVANKVAPAEVESYIDQRIAPYCDDQSTSDEAANEQPMNGTEKQSLQAFNLRGSSHL